MATSSQDMLNNIDPNSPNTGQQSFVTGLYDQMQGLLANYTGQTQSGDDQTGGAPWDPVGTQESVMQFDTSAANIGYNKNMQDPTGALNYDPNSLFAPQDNQNVSGFRADGSVGIPDTVKPYTREVQNEELTSYQMNQLLNSDSKFIQDARRQGLEQANAVGGLGGTVGVGASMQAAIRSALPIAESDAQSYRQAASENLTALNQFSQLNLQRATQLELGALDSKTKLSAQKMANGMQWAVSKLQDATQRDISMLDANTRLRAEEMGAQIQEKLADINFVYTAMLNDLQNVNRLREIAMQGDYALANTDLSAQWEAAITELQGEYALANTGLTGQYDMAKIALGGEWDLIQKEMEYNLQAQLGFSSMVISAYDGYLGRLADLNGVEMDQAARDRAIREITDGYTAMTNLINSLFPQYGETDPGTGG